MSAKEAPINDFGLLIAYVLPGFTALWGTTFLSDSLKFWFGNLPSDSTTVGGFLLLTVASIGVGLTVSTIRWMLVDSIHHWTGVKAPVWDFFHLKESAAAFGILVDIHYRYYQFYSGMFLSLLWVFTARRWSLGFFDAPLGRVDAGLLLLAVVFFLGSRDTLRKYYARTGQLLQKQTIQSMEK